MDQKSESDDTPRSMTSPRDERFYTPRTIGRANSMNSNYNSLSDDSNSPRTPRFETPRYGGYGSAPSDNEFQTPRQTPRQSPRPSVYSQPKAANPPSIPRPQVSKDVDSGRSSSIAITTTYASDTKSSSGYPTAERKEGYYAAYTFDNSSEKKSSSFNNKHNSTAAPADEIGIDFIENDANLNEMMDSRAGYENLGLSETDVEDIFSFARHGRCEEVDKLLDRGIPVDVRDVYGNTVLIIACQNGNKRVTKSVLRRGANINARNHKGNTPLHYCYHYGYGESLGQYIISKGADPEVRNRAGKLPWDGI